MRVAKARTAVAFQLSARRRGHAAVMMVVLLAGMSLFVTAVVLRTGRDQDLTIQRASSVRATYALEAVISMALRELALNVDLDLDGSVGSIAMNDGKPSVSLDIAHLGAQKLLKGKTIELRFSGRSGEVVKEQRITLALSDVAVPDPKLVGDKFSKPKGDKKVKKPNLPKGKAYGFYGIKPPKSKGK